MTSKKEIKDIELSQEKKNSYNIIEVDSDPREAKIFRQYYGEVLRCIKEFEDVFGKLDKNHKIYHWKNNRMIYIVDKKITEYGE
jgi:hypothetical protein